MGQSADAQARGGACFDCHSNESKPYTWEKVAPLSWWITNHVKDGHRVELLRVHEGRPGENDASETVRNGSMPPNYYTWLGLHSDAKLTAREKQALADRLTATLVGGTAAEAAERRSVAQRS